MGQVCCCLILSNCSLALDKDSFRKPIFDSEFGLEASAYQTEKKRCYSLCLRNLIPFLFQVTSQMNNFVEVKCPLEWPLKTQIILGEVLSFRELQKFIDTQWEYI